MHSNFNSEILNNLLSNVNNLYNNAKYIEGFHAINKLIEFDKTFLEREEMKSLIDSVANNLFSLGEFDKCIKARELIKQPPINDFYYNYQLAYSYLFFEKTEESQKHLNNLLENYKGSELVLNLQGILLIHNKKYSEAVKILKKAIAINETPASLALLSCCYQNLYFEQISLERDKSPRDASIYLRKIIDPTTINDSLALSYYSEVLADFAISNQIYHRQEFYKKFISICPSPKVYNDLAKQSFLVGDIYTQINSLNMAFKLSNKLDYLIQIADIHYYGYNMESFNETIARILEINPKSYYAQERLARLEINKDNYQEAAKYIKKAIEYGSTNIETIIIADTIADHFTSSNKITEIKQAIELYSFIAKHSYYKDTANFDIAECYYKIAKIRKNNKSSKKLIEEYLNKSLSSIQNLINLDADKIKYKIANIRYLLLSDNTVIVSNKIDELLEQESLLKLDEVEIVYLCKILFDASKDLKNNQDVTSKLSKLIWAFYDNNNANQEIYQNQCTPFSSFYRLVDLCMNSKQGKELGNQIRDLFKVAIEKTIERNPKSGSFYFQAFDFIIYYYPNEKNLLHKLFYKLNGFNYSNLEGSPVLKRLDQFTFFEVNTANHDKYNIGNLPNYSIYWNYLDKQTKNKITESAKYSQFDPIANTTKMLEEKGKTSEDNHLFHLPFDVLKNICDYIYGNSINYETFVKLISKTSYVNNKRTRDDSSTSLPAAKIFKPADINKFDNICRNV